MTNSISDLRDADVMFIIGSNTTEAHPVLSLEVVKALREGKTLIVADPRKIDVARAGPRAPAAEARHQRACCSRA